MSMLGHQNLVYIFPILLMNLYIIYIMQNGLAENILLLAYSNTVFN